MGYSSWPVRFCIRTDLRSTFHEEIGFSIVYFFPTQQVILNELSSENRRLLSDVCSALFLCSNLESPCNCVAGILYFDLICKIIEWYERDLIVK